MEEIRCTKCNKMLGKIFAPDAVAVQEKETIQQLELYPDGKPKRIEIKCPRCNILNEVIV